MKNTKKGILMLILLIVAVLATIGGILAYMFIATDAFKSEQELFGKYLIQNFDELNKITEIERFEQIGSKIKENKHEGDIKILIDDLELATLNIQKDPENKKQYGKFGLVSSSDNENLELEYMIDNDMYSLRFTNAVKQFLSVENNNLKELAEKLFVLDEDDLEKIPDSIDLEMLSLGKIKLTDQEKKAETDKYTSLISNSIAKDNYSKSKDVVITINEKTITTNSYILKLSKQEIKDLLIKILETFEQDQIILNKLELIDKMLEEFTRDYTEEYMDNSIKDNFLNEVKANIDELKELEIKEEKDIIITVYELQGKTVRIKAEQGLSHITLDTTEEQGQQRIDFNYTNVNDIGEHTSSKVTIFKESSEKFKIELSNIEGEEQQTIDFDIQLIEKEQNVQINIKINSGENSLEIENHINFVDEINYKVELDNSNNIILNDISKKRITSIFEVLGPRILKEYKEPIEQIALTVLMNSMGNALDDADLSGAEISTFNSKFAMYGGDNLPETTVKSLINTVLLHNAQQRVSGTNKYVIVTGDISVQEDDENMPKIESNKSYSIKCKTDPDGRINEIVITEN